MDKEVLFAFIRTVVALPLVLALAYLVIKYGLARRSTQSLYGAGRRMRVIEQMPLGPKGFLSIVEIGGKYYLLAHSEQGIKLIEKYDQLPQPLSGPDLAEKLPNFRDLLKRKIKNSSCENSRSKGENGGEK